MPDSSIYNLLQRMDTDDVVLAYRGEINSELLEAVYEMMSEGKTDKNKKFFPILIESLQNIFHHQASLPEALKTEKQLMTGFVITCDKQSKFKLMTGNYILNENVDKLKNRLEHVNSLTPEALRTHYQQTLSENEFSEKGGAGLGIIEMARKSGSKLDYEFKKINNEYSYFSLAISIP